MGLPTRTPLANRYGLDVEVFEYGADIEVDEPLAIIDFANSCEVNLDAELVWATGRQDHSRQIGFHNAIQGGLTISTQIVNQEVLSILAGKVPTPGTNLIIFDNIPRRPLIYFTLRGKTVWQDEMGMTHSETLIFYKAIPRLALNLSYGDDGEPLNCDLIFDLMANEYGKAVKVVIDYQAEPLIDGDGYYVVDSNGAYIYVPIKPSSYKIQIHAIGCTYSGPREVSPGHIIAGRFYPVGDNAYPIRATIRNAAYTLNPDTGVVTISNPTDTVRIVAEATATPPYVYTVENGVVTMETAPYTVENGVLTIV